MAEGRDTNGPGGVPGSGDSNSSGRLPAQPMPSAFAAHSLNGWSSTDHRDGGDDSATRATSRVQPTTASSTSHSNGTQDIHVVAVAAEKSLAAVAPEKSLAAAHAAAAGSGTGAMAAIDMERGHTASSHLDAAPLMQIVYESLTYTVMVRGVPLRPLGHGEGAGGWWGGTRRRGAACTTMHTRPVRL